MPHIAYFGSEPPNAQKLKYAYKDATGWHIEYVEEDFGYTISPTKIVSLAVDQSGRPHISCDSNFGLLYGTRSGIAAPSPTPVPQAEIVLNGSSFRAGDRLAATFQLNESIQRPFTAFAVVILPGRAMLNALTLDTPLMPVATNVPGLTIAGEPFTFPLINATVPAGAPPGGYEIVVAFFTPGVPITGRGDAFLEAGAPFTVER
jgi:hypothetical protein